ncbi:MAG: hypothetical protein HWE30_15005 [Methylocystaceae bacterium]|nr:hypothetical protein [Methylocystaceae bacterium]
MNNRIHDENLRLIYSQQESDFLDEKQHYYLTSLWLCLLGAIGVPIFFTINHYFLGTGSFMLLLLSFLWAILGMFAAMNLPFVVFKVFKYRKLKSEHIKFLQRYNRLTK